MIPATCTGPFTWDRVKDMALIVCGCCDTQYYIPQCCTNVNCPGCEEE
jgi:hypothetical protein